MSYPVPTSSIMRSRPYVRSNVNNSSEDRKKAPRAASVTSPGSRAFWIERAASNAAKNVERIMVRVRCSFSRANTAPKDSPSLSKARGLNATATEAPIANAAAIQTLANKNLRVRDIVPSSGTGADTTS